jgi:beta-xylosidase
MTATNFAPAERPVRLPTLPIIGGFNPDPSIYRIGDAYHLADSSSGLGPRSADPPLD